MQSYCGELCASIALIPRPPPQSHQVHWQRSSWSSSECTPWCDSCGRRCLLSVLRSPDISLLSLSNWMAPSSSLSSAVALSFLRGCLWTLCWIFCSVSWNTHCSFGRISSEWVDWLELVSVNWIPSSECPRSCLQSWSQVAACPFSPAKPSPSGRSPGSEAIPSRVPFISPLWLAGDWSYLPAVWRMASKGRPRRRDLHSNSSSSKWALFRGAGSGSGLTAERRSWWSWCSDGGSVTHWYEPFDLLRFTSRICHILVSPPQLNHHQ